MTKDAKIEKIIELVNGDLSCEDCPMKEKCDNTYGYDGIELEECGAFLFTHINDKDIEWEKKEEMKEYKVRFSFNPIYVTVAATSEEEAKEFARHKFDVEHMNRAIEPSSASISGGYTWE